MSDPKEPKIWTPAAKMNANVGKMAWAMFLEDWKHGQDSDSPLVDYWRAKYEECVKVATAIEEFQNPKSEVPGL